MKVKIFISLFLILLALPLSALTFYKQSRVIVPELYGITCIDDFICLENIKKKDDAKTLYEYALKMTEKKLSELQSKPMVIFCSTSQCSERFGLKRVKAFNMGTFGIIISHKGWESYIVTHEFIHYWQSSITGNIKMLLLSNQQWLIEGMAYSMSEDPRLALIKPYQSYRSTFNSWLSVNKINNIKLAFKSESKK